MTAVSVQNYGMNSYMIKRPFDFAGRTGKIVFDVDAVNVNWLGTFISLDITEDPVSAPTFREFGNFEHGPIPRNGIMIKWSDNCLVQGTAVTLGKTIVYSNYTPYDHRTHLCCQPVYDASVHNHACGLPESHRSAAVTVASRDLRFELLAGRWTELCDLQRIYSANINLPFTRGYVHIAARNHASAKYGYGPVGAVPLGQRRIRWSGHRELSYLRDTGQYDNRDVSCRFGHDHHESRLPVAGRHDRKAGRYLHPSVRSVNCNLRESMSPA